MAKASKNKRVGVEQRAVEVEEDSFGCHFAFLYMGDGWTGDIGLGESHGG